MQRWLNRDPAGEAGGINLYGFVLNDPLSNSDPLGLDVYKIRYPDPPYHEAVIGDDPDTGGYWFADFGPDGGKAITGPGKWGYGPWSWPPNQQPNGIKVVCRIPTTPAVDRALRNKAAQDAQTPPPKYNCITQNCWEYADSLMEEARRRMTPPRQLPVIPPSMPYYYPLPR
jgi:uncharacterized protein RhaS with RHS repeats